MSIFQANAYVNGINRPFFGDDQVSVCKQIAKAGLYSEECMKMLRYPLVSVKNIPINKLVHSIVWDGPSYIANVAKDAVSNVATKVHELPSVATTAPDLWPPYGIPKATNLMCEVPGFTPADVAESAGYSYTTIGLGVAAGAATLAALYGAYWYLTQPNKPEKPEEKPEPDVVKPDPLVKLKIIPSKAYEHGLEKLSDAESVLKDQALGKVEKDKLEKIFAGARQTLKQGLKSTYGLSHDKILEEILNLIKDLNAISYEGKGILEEDKPELSYYKRAVTAITEALQYVFSFIGQFFAGEYNPVSKALMGRSFFLSAPMTVREEKAVHNAKESAICVLENIEADRVMPYTIES